MYICRLKIYIIDLLKYHNISTLLGFYIYYNELFYLLIVGQLPFGLSSKNKNRKNNRKCPVNSHYPLNIFHFTTYLPKLTPDHVEQTFFNGRMPPNPHYMPDYASDKLAK
jgi:hypothetical protein